MLSQSRPSVDGFHFRFAAIPPKETSVWGTSDAPCGTTVKDFKPGKCNGDSGTGQPSAVFVVSWARSHPSKGFTQYQCRIISRNDQSSYAKDSLSHSWYFCRFQGNMACGVSALAKHAPKLGWSAMAPISCTRNATPSKIPEGSILSFSLSRRPSITEPRPMDDKSAARTTDLPCTATRSRNVGAELVASGRCIDIGGR